MGRRHRLLLRGLTGGYLASLAPSYRRFLEATRSPRAAQDRVLKDILRLTEGSVQGRRYRLDGVRSLADFQRRVPARTYDEYADDIARVADGEPHVLTRGEVRMLERSSGSTRGNKLIPYGKELLGDFSAATGPWLFSMYAARPRLLGTKSYWSVSPVARARERSKGGLPIGFEDDTEYFGPAARWAIGKMLAVPGSVARLRDVEAWRDATFRYLLAAEDLGFVSVWSPTFLTGLMRDLEGRIEALLPELPAERAVAIRRGLDAAGAVTGPALWPRLALISCWTDGHAARFVPEVHARFPGVEVQPKGLLATEGVFSFPLTPLVGPPEPGAVAALRSHLLELVDLDAPARPPIPVHHARVGGRYTPLMSTRGGLLRYALRDEVECVGFTRAAPRFRFVGKLDQVSDVCGEKLCAGEVERALDRAQAEAGARPRFAMLAPDLEARPARYRLFVELPGGDPARFAAAVDAALLANHHYRYAREIGQLDPVEACGVEDGAARYQAALMARGVRAGDIKPTPLDSRGFWVEVFGAAAVAPPNGE